MKHGIVVHRPNGELGYFGWPSVARMADGTLVAAASGMRNRHVCPWGKTVLATSRDEGETWSEPRAINDSPIDDRDAGIVDAGGGVWLVSWFTSDTRQYLEVPGFRGGFAPAMRQRLDETVAGWTDALVDEHLGSWVMASPDAGATWGTPVRVPVSAPHGPIRLSDGSLLYLGRTRVDTADHGPGEVAAYASRDRGATWQYVGTVPPGEGTAAGDHFEPHVAELPDGQLVGATRLEFKGDDATKRAEAKGLVGFSMHLTASDDGGRTWTPTRALRYGSPPHLCVHSSGALICTYGFRREPYGQRAVVSRDGGETWSDEIVLRDDGPSGDLGYPATVELSDGSLFTVYYQQMPGEEQCSLLWTKWAIPSAQGTPPSGASRPRG